MLTYWMGTGEDKEMKGRAECPVPFETETLQHCLKEDLSLFWL